MADNFAFGRSARGTRAGFTPFSTLRFRMMTSRADAAPSGVRAPGGSANRVGRRATARGPGEEISTSMNFNVTGMCRQWTGAALAVAGMLGGAGWMGQSVASAATVVGGGPGG